MDTCNFSFFIYFLVEPPITFAMSFTPAGNQPNGVVWDLVPSALDGQTQLQGGALARLARGRLDSSNVARVFVIFFFLFIDVVVFLL